ncbi:MAG: tail fiber domain-containing protein [Bacteroidota bacterium]|nr:tail fiber domain-containing protein [Bacteroidota bacterium]
MKKLVSIFVLGFIVLSFGAFAQLNINSSGNVEIDTNGAASRFSIGGVGFSNSKAYIFNSNTSSSQKGLEVSQALTSSDWSYATISSVVSGSSSAKVVGVRGSGYKSAAYSTGMSFGVYGVAGNAQSGYNYGVFGQILGTNNGAAIFGSTPGKYETPVNGIYAGYFRGNVYVENNLGVGLTNPGYKLEVNGDINAMGYVRSNGVILTSDSRKKTDIQVLKNGNLSKLNSLKVVTFKYKQPDLNAEKLDLRMQQDTGKVESSVSSAIQNPELYQQMQIGLLAQDLQKVYPDLVIADKEGVLGINYTGLVAVLVAAVKEQQTEIDALKLQIGK